MRKGFVIPATITALSATSAGITSRWALRRVEKAVKEKPARRVEGSKVSVIIPTILEENYLPKLLRTLEHQTLAPFEVLIIDRNSTDRTPEIAAESGTVLIQGDYNVSEARNLGAEQAKGEILAFFDGDVALAQDTLERLAAGLEKFKVTHGEHHIYDSWWYGGIWGLRAFFAPTYTSLSKQLDGRDLVMRRETFFEIGRFNPSLNPRKGHREDLEFGKRAYELYGREAIACIRGAIVATSARRARGDIGSIFRKGWRVAGVRDSKVVE